MMKNNTTICFFNTTKTWGGGEKWHFEMAINLFKNNIKVLVVVSENSELHKKLKSKNIQVEVVNVSNFSYLNPFKVKKVKKIYQKHQVKTVVLNSSEDMKLGGLAAKKASVKRIIYRRGSAIPIKNSFINRYFFKHVITEVLANSLATKKTINQNYNLFSDENIIIIPNGINIENFNKITANKLYQKKDKELVIGNLGRVVYQKNQTALIDLAEELKERNVQFKLLIGGDGKLLPVLKEKVSRLGLQDEVIFLGFVENPKAFMNSIDIFVLTSHWEGFGYVLAEAMLCEKPVIAYDISSNSQLIDHKKNGFLVSYNNIKELANRVEELISIKQKKRMGTTGKHKIEQEFSMVDIKKKVQNYLLQE